MIELTCRYDGPTPVLVVAGPVHDGDLPLFRTVLESTLDGPHRTVAVDLTQADVGPGVRRLCSKLAARLQREGRTLDVRGVERGTAGEEALRQELDEVRAAMDARVVIEQAKGVLMATVGCDADEAFRLLVQQSQHENRKLRVVAAELVERQGRRPAEASGL